MPTTPTTPTVPTMPTMTLNIHSNSLSSGS
jgi:hypothetical protein